MVAEYFAREKAELALVSQNEDNLGVVLNNIRKGGVKTAPLVIIEDFPQNAKSIIDKTIEKFGHLDILFNNAPFTKPISIRNSDMKDFDTMMTKNIRNIIELSNCAVPHLIISKGCIINNSCVYGSIPEDHFMSYCISKAAIEHFTKCAALELASKKVRVNCITPDCIDHDVHTFMDLDREKIEEEFRAFVKHAGIKNSTVNVKEPIYVTLATLFLAKDDRFNGCVVPVHGGISSYMKEITEM